MAFATMETKPKIAYKVVHEKESLTATEEEEVVEGELVVKAVVAVGVLGIATPFMGSIIERDRDFLLVLFAIPEAPPRARSVKIEKEEEEMEG